MRINLDKVKRAVAAISPRKKNKNKGGGIADIEGEKKSAKRTVERATQKSHSSFESSVKLKSSDLSGEYQLANKADREIFYDKFLSMSEKYPQVEGGKDGRGIWVVDGPDVTSIMGDFVQSEIKKRGFEFRWEGKDDVFFALSSLGMANRRNNVGVDDWLEICKAFNEDPDFQAWKSSKESRSPKVNSPERRPPSNGPKIKSASASSGAKHLAEFVREFQEICKAHDQRTDEMGGKTYAVGAKGQPALQAFLQSEIQRPGFSQRWTPEIRTQFRAVNSSLLKNTFNFEAWRKLRIAVENSLEHPQMLAASPRGQRPKSPRRQLSGRHGATSHRESPGSGRRPRDDATTNQKAILSKSFGCLKEVRSDLDLDQLILLFVSEAKKRHPDFPDPVFNEVIIQAVNEHNKSSGENVSAEHALAAVKNSALHVTSLATGSNISDRNEIDACTAEQGDRGFSNRLMLDPSSLRPFQVRPADSRNIDTGTKGIHGGPRNTVNITRLDLKTPLGGFGLQPFAMNQGSQLSISPPTSPDRNTYRQPTDQRSIQPYPQQQGVQYPQGVQFVDTGNTGPTLFERILADDPKQ